MRKNGINREIRPIEGGVCAPEGYKANAVACGIKENGELDLGLLFSERRCAVACVYATGNTLGAPVKITQKHMRYGYARAVLVNGGVANCTQEGGERLALSVCDLLFPYGIERTEIVNASTGYIGRSLRLSNFQEGIKPLYEGLTPAAEGSWRLAQSIRAEGSEGREVAYTFDLGDYPCKIGCVFKGGAHVSPNMATFLAFLTTDVKISAPMLQKALGAAVRETLNMLNVDGISSPNDTVCILANGRAGNYKIDCEDSEYKKFVYALRAVLREICLKTVQEGGKRSFLCHVSGAISKEAARSAAKALAGANSLKRAFAEGDADMEGILFTLLSNAVVQTEKLQVTLRSERGEVVLLDGGTALPPSRETLAPIFAGEEVELRVEFGEGNFGATAYGNIEKA